MTLRFHPPMDRRAQEMRTAEHLAWQERLDKICYVLFAVSIGTDDFRADFDEWLVRLIMRESTHDRSFWQ